MRSENDTIPLLGGKFSHSLMMETLYGALQSVTELQNHFSNCHQIYWKQSRA